MDNENKSVQDNTNTYETLGSIYNMDDVSDSDTQDNHKDMEGSSSVRNRSSPTEYNNASEKNGVTKFEKRLIFVIGFIAFVILSSATISGFIVRQLASDVYDAGFLPYNSMLAYLINGFKAGLKLTCIIAFVMASFIILFYVTMIKKHTKHDDRNFEISDKGILGTSGFMNQSEKDAILKSDDIYHTLGNILGVDKDTGKILSLKEDVQGFNRHKAICGSSGTMKSRSQFRPDIFQAIRRGESFIALDSKGELYSDTSKIAEKHGYNTKVFNLINHAYSDACALLKAVDSTPMAMTFVNVIMSNTKTEKSAGNPYWENGETTLLLACVLYIVLDKNRSIEERSMGALYDLIADTDISTMDGLFGRLSKDHPAKKVYNAIISENDTSKKGFKSGLATRLTIFVEKRVRYMTTYDEIDFTAPAKEKCAYYVILSDQDSTFNFVATLFFQLLFIKTVMFADRQPDLRCPVPVNVLLDELPNVGFFPDFQRKMATFRSRGINCTFSFQDIPLLAERFPDNIWASLISQCDTHVFLGTNETEVTDLYYSNLTGIMTVEAQTKRVSKKRISFNTHIPEYSESTTYQGRAVMTRDEIRRMDPYDMMVIIKGQKPIIVKKYDFSNHPMSKEIEPCNQIEHIPAWWSIVGFSEDENMTNFELNEKKERERVNQRKERYKNMDAGGTGYTSDQQHNTTIPAAEKGTVSAAAKNPQPAAGQAYSQVFIPLRDVRDQKFQQQSPNIIGQPVEHQPVRSPLYKKQTDIPEDF